MKIANYRCQIFHLLVALLILVIFSFGDAIYDDIILDVYDYLKGCIDSAVLAGIKKENIIVDHVLEKR